MSLIGTRLTHAVQHKQSTQTGKTGHQGTVKATPKCLERWKGWVAQTCYAASVTSSTDDPLSLPFRALPPAVLGARNRRQVSEPWPDNARHPCSHQSCAFLERGYAILLSHKRPSPRLPTAHHL